MKLPALQFYPGDWRKDPAVQSLSFHDRGVWFELLLLMFESPQRGRLVLKEGIPMPEDALARLLGLDKQKLNQTLSTLLDFGVCERDGETGVIFSRRMVRDEEVREKRRESGKKGGNPLLLKQKGYPPDNQRPNQRPKQKTTPSSSSSISSSEVPPLPPDDEIRPPCTIDQARSQAPMARMTPEEAEHWWHVRNASGWTKSSASGGAPRRITSWQSDMATSASWVKESLHKARNTNSAGKAKVSL